ncbi:MAG: aminoacyl-histidine dipeptidase [Clostridiales bacterium]|nr:aminoacyl-histidine dipeptidase [Clostridiales bacterium]
MSIINLQPERVFHYFEQISNIPRGSGNEKAVSDYCVATAKALGLSTFQDESNNVVIRKPATPGYENAPGVIIQGHLDMVCEKNNKTEHDFKTDGIKLVVDGDWLKADGTTLGGDDGIAVAMGFALMEAKDIEHPALECLFTTDEEVGMGGAKNFDASVLQGKRLINLDSEDEGIFVVSCCGGAKATIAVPGEWESVPEGLTAVRIKIRGLLGGHSGTDINLQRANANKLMGRVLRQIAKTFYFRLESINGGLMDNAITRECDAVIYTAEEDFEELEDMCGQFQSIFNNEYSGSEDGIFVIAEKADNTENRVLKAENAQNVIYVLNLIPYGVERISLEINGLVESSNNIGVVKTTADGIELTSAVRSSVATVKYDILERLSMIAEVAGGSLTIKSEYPGWEYKKDSKLREVCVEAYKEMFGKEPQIEAIHAGLECGLLSSKAPDIDMISIGPEMHDVHTPAEKISIASVGRTWDYLKFVLKKLK